MDFNRYVNFPPVRFDNKHIISDTLRAWLETLNWDQLTDAYRALKAKLAYESQELKINEIIYDQEFALIRQSNLVYDTSRQEVKDAFDFYERAAVNEIYGSIVLQQIQNIILEHINSDTNHTIVFRGE